MPRFAWQMVFPSEQPLSAFEELLSVEVAIRRCAETVFRDPRRSSPAALGVSQVGFHVLQKIEKSDTDRSPARIFIPRTRLGRLLIRLRGLQRRIFGRPIKANRPVTIESSVRVRHVAQIVFREEDVIVESLRFGEFWPDADSSRDLSILYIHTLNRSGLRPISA